MNCTICGTATPHGTLLCRPCKAALKRARQLTVQEVPQRSSRWREKGVRHEVPVEPSAGTDTLQRPLRSDRAARLLLGAVAIAALAGAAYVAAREFAGRAAIPHGPPALMQPSASEPTPVIGAAAAEAIGAALAAPAAVPELVSSPPLRPHASAPVRAAAAAPVPAAASTMPSTHDEPAAAPETSAYPPLDSFGPAFDVQKPAPPPTPAPIQRATPPPDRWQTMSDALARCASEGGFSGFICDQRVRLASCDGYWGRVAQCPVPPENPR